MQKLRNSIFLLILCTTSSLQAGNSPLTENAQKTLNSHRIAVCNERIVNETGLDFQVLNGIDKKGKPWILRIARRADVFEKAKIEYTVLKILAKEVHFTIPKWKIFSSELIAYPEIPGNPAAVKNAESEETTWFVQNLDEYEDNLALILSQIHNVSAFTLQEEGLSYTSIEQVKESIRADIALIQDTFTVAPQLLEEWNSWLDKSELWPEHSVFVHGDFHQGNHILALDGKIAGIIDWTESRFDDPSVDFIFHYIAFGIDGLNRLFERYVAHGGTLWPNAVEHTIQRAKAFKIVFAAYAIRTNQEALIKQAKVLLQENASL